MSNELGRLVQGNDAGVQSTDCMEFIYKHEVPDGRKVTYANFVCDHRPLKSEPFRIRLVVGGDRLEYTADAGSPAASMLETKLLVNSVISDAGDGAKFMSSDLKDFFLSSTMAQPEYMRIPWKYIPDDIRTRYNLHHKKHHDYVYVKIKRGMYGLKQAAILAYEQLVDHLKLHGYEPVIGTTCIFHHKTRRTKFCLCVDDFGVKYYTKNDLDHFLDTLRKKYTVTTDMNFCGLTFDWHYNDGYVDMSMPEYVTKALQRLNYQPSKQPQYSPHEHNPITKMKKGMQQYANDDHTPFVSKTDTTWVQSVVGTFLYYARAIDNTILPALRNRHITGKSYINYNEKMSTTTRLHEHV